MIDLTLNIFPSGGGLGQSVITTVWVGIAVIGFLNLRFGFPLTGLVVPGYIVPLLIVSPTSAIVILVEAVIVYFVMKVSAKTLLEHFGFAEMFGRDRFFAIILISILVRVTMDTLFWPPIAGIMSTWDISFDYASQLYSLGLIIIALTANVMWNGGFRYGVKVTAVQLTITYIIVRFVLMPFTNFSIANLAIMYEAVAASIIAAPKAYIILVITAFIASRANIKYGWEFNGILLPALLALQLMQPSKLLTSFIETAIILIIGSGLLHYTKLRHANFEGARLLLFFFNIGFIYKLLLNYVILHYYPTVKVTDTFAFGYMLSTLLALKIYQKNALGFVIRATLQTSVIGGGIAISIGFIIMYIPSLFKNNGINETQKHMQQASLSQAITQYKSHLYTAAPAQMQLEQFRQQQDIEKFKAAIDVISQLKIDSSQYRHAVQHLKSLDFTVSSDTHFIYIHDTRKRTPRGLFVITKEPHSNLIVTVPHPSSERLASDAAGLLLPHLKASAMALGTQKTQFLNDDSLSQQSKYYYAFIAALASNQVLQVRAINSFNTQILSDSPFKQKCQFWIYNQLPKAVKQTQLSNLLNCDNITFGLMTPESLPNSHTSGQFLEIFLTSQNFTSLISKVTLANNRLDKVSIEVKEETPQQAVDNFNPFISAKGSNDFKLLTDSEASLWEFEILRPLFTLIDTLSGNNLNQDVLNRLNQINDVARIVGYQLSIITSEQGHFLKIAPIGEPQYYKQGQGLYLINLNPTSAITVQVPRPLFESNTLKFSAQLYSNIQGKVLLVAGAHPFAAPHANVVAATNVKTLFNVVHQSTLRYNSQYGIVNLQIRSHSTPSRIRPSALAFQFTQADKNHTATLEQLYTQLSRLGVQYQIVSGEDTTRGLELGSSPQTGYQIFAPNSELATLWLASDFKQHFAISEQALLERLSAISEQPKPVLLRLSTLAPYDWSELPHTQSEKIKKLANDYALSHHLPLLSSYCLEAAECALQVIRLVPSHELALLIKQQDKIAMIYFPLRNKLVDYTSFKEAMIRGEHVLR
ncbi:hypothetical protein PSECIP111951_03067 [Pseudoalteromonas holothuriae]|uniref:Capsule biosynthesis CapC n=1 Tax=Pseudoalteromonas holothuriae TaxID=2963714 RepID=A0ABM9GKX8_9GAMM|nr:poly-gamma-glutamate biosynthesis protein PgsC/CapC [Pseudoalteromonas sp. CIP111951]CAH9064179.1 hypothetical protein PSECIP111951_03067 [Pseudoalteromonas sp. CIP111951]